MAVHDWTRVDAGTFHAFHTAWVTHLSEALNGGVLPPGYYAMPEQHLGRSVADVLALHAGSPAAPTPAAQLPGEGQAVAVAPPRVRQRITLSASTRARRRTVTVRHVSGHRVVALIEIVSPANKDRPAHVEDLAGKVVQALAAGVHVLLADLLPRGPHDPNGIHGAVCDLLDPEARPFDAEGSLGPLRQLRRRSRDRRVPRAVRPRRRPPGHAAVLGVPAVRASPARCDLPGRVPWPARTLARRAGSRGRSLGGQEGPTCQTCETANRLR
jgi:hypothetical protein